MTPERLALIKEHIKNPPSASLNRDWMLELAAELERRMALDQPPLTFDDALRNAISPEVAAEVLRQEAEIAAGREPVVIDDRPAKKKGKK